MSLNLIIKSLCISPRQKLYSQINIAPCTNPKTMAGL